MKFKILVVEMSPFMFAILLSCSGSKDETKTPVVKSKGDITSNEERHHIIDSSHQLEKTTPTTKTSSAGIELHKRTVLRKIEVSIPASFKTMTAELRSIKYPLKENSDFEVYTNEAGSVNIAFEHSVDKATVEQLPAIRQILDQQFNQPGINYMGSAIQKVNGRDFIVIRMITPAIDSEIYNLMYITCLDQRLLLCTFNCPTDNLKEWQPVATSILNSIELQR